MASSQPIDRVSPPITEFAVNAINEARHVPASDASQRTGALIRLESCVRTNADACVVAAERSRAPEVAERVADLAKDLASFAELVADEVTRLGGTMERRPFPVPHEAAVFAYTHSDGGLLERIDTNLGEVERLWTEAADHGELPAELVAAHGQLPTAP